MSYVSGLGVDAQSTATACATYSADLAKWQQEQKLYQAALAARSAAMASDAAAYKAAYASYTSALAAQAISYAQAAGPVFAKYKAKAPSGMPACVPKATHDLAVTNCDLINNPLRGLGAFNWSVIPACLLSELPVCQTPPPKPAAPVAPPMPTLRAKPVAPTGCTSTTKPTVTTVNTQYPTTPLSPVQEASLTPQTKSGAGLIVVAVLGAAAVGYLFLRKKKAA